MSQKMSKDELTQRQLFARDKGLCGIHIGGCKRQMTEEEMTKDHLIPRAFIKYCPKEVQAQLYGDLYNLQAMCSDCNTNRFGQIWNTFPKFQCSCHAILIDDDGYACLVSTIKPNRSRDKESKFFSTRLHRRAIGNGIMIAGQKGLVRGAGVDVMGHLFYIPDIFRAYGENYQELVRTGWVKDLVWEQRTIRIKIREEYQQARYIPDGHPNTSQQVGILPTIPFPPSAGHQHTIWMDAISGTITLTERNNGSTQRVTISKETEAEKARRENIAGILAYSPDYKGQPIFPSAPETGAD